MARSQGSRQRALTLSFKETFQKLISLLAGKNPEDKAYYFGCGYLLRYKEGDTATLLHDGAEQAIWYIKLNRQWGSTKAIEVAIKEIEVEGEGALSDLAASKLKDASTRLNNLLLQVRKDHPSAGLSFSGDKLMILKDVEQAETPDNILSTASLAGAVRAVF